MANVFKDTCIKLQVSVLRLKNDIWNIWYARPAVQFIWRACWIWWTERSPQIHFMKFCPIQYDDDDLAKKCRKTVIICPSLWEWAGWILGHSALFLSLLWAFSSPQRYHQSINTAISRWIILSSSINTFAHDRCILDRKKTISTNQISSQVVAVFLAYSRTSVVMASGRELCYVLLLGDFAKTVSLGRGRIFLTRVLLLGILLSYSAPFILLARPSPVSCAVLRSEKATWSEQCLADWH